MPDPAAAAWRDDASAHAAVPTATRDRTLRGWSARWVVPLDPAGVRLRLGPVSDVVAPRTDHVIVKAGRWDAGAGSAHRSLGFYAEVDTEGGVAELLVRMYVDSEEALVVGRSLWGERKFWGEVSVDARQDGQAAVSVRRAGGLLLQAHAQADPPASTEDATAASATLNVLPRSTAVGGGNGVPIISRTRWTIRRQRPSRGTGALWLHPPLVAGERSLRLDATSAAWGDCRMDGEEQLTPATGCPADPEQIFRGSLRHEPLVAAIPTP